MITSPCVSNWPAGCCGVGACYAPIVVAGTLVCHFCGCVITLTYAMVDACLCGQGCYDGVDTLFHLAVTATYPATNMYNNIVYGLVLSRAA